MMHAFNRPEAETPNQPITTEPVIERADPHGQIAFDNLRDLVKSQQREIGVLAQGLLELGRSQGALRDNLIALTTRCSELAGAVSQLVGGVQ